MKFCPYCGSGLSEEMNYCPKCGKPFNGGYENPHNKETDHTTNDHNSDTKEMLKDTIELPQNNRTGKKKSGHGTLIGIFLTIIAIGIIGVLWVTLNRSAKHSFIDDTIAIKTASDSVLMLSCYDQNGEEFATGSGFVVFDDDIIVTNYHVIEDSYRIVAKSESGNQYECSTVVAYDVNRDIAILRTNLPTRLTPFIPGPTDDLKKGEKVVAIGSPLGLINSVSTGVFSGYISDDAGSVLQFTASISHGSSGGALFNNSGEVIGITFGSYVDGQNLNLAVPIEEATILYDHAKKPVELQLNIYTWDGYITDGSNGGFDVLRGFESWFEKEYGKQVRINHYCYSTNEEMYENVNNGTINYDIIIPTDYMIDIMAKENKLLPIDFANIPYYSQIRGDFKGLYFDPDNKYSVPFLYGITGIIYNANAVSEGDIGNWDLLWNEKYRGKILQFGNPRDAFGTAQQKLDLDVNSREHSIWDRALAELKSQMPNVGSYDSSNIFSLMETGEMAICSYYAGDYFTMRFYQKENVDLKFYYPSRSNCFVDSMCIPFCAQNKELAEVFINYMLSSEPAIANAEYVLYPSPNSAVYSNSDYQEWMGKEAMEILYPDINSFRAFHDQNAFHNLDADTLNYINQLWYSLIQ